MTLKLSRRDLMIGASSAVATAFLACGLASAGTQASRTVDHSKEYEAMSMKDDLAHRSPDIHRPTWYRNSKDVEIQGGDPVLRDVATLKWVAEAK